MTTILAVDDEEDMLEVIAYNLEREGHDVLRAQNARDALAILDRETPDLIISDIMMPGMDGLAFCAEVRTRKETALTPFLFVTAKTQADDKYAGLRVGADDYITKPFDLPDLIARVHGRLEHRERMRGLERRLQESEQRWAESYEPEELKTIHAEQRQIVDEVQESGHVQYEPPDPDGDALRAKIARFEERFEGLAELRQTELVGESDAHLRVFEEIVIAASSPDPTSIFGDTGTGKTATAEAIWKLSKRKDGPFRTVNCSELAAGDPTIATGKLFGYGKNSGLPNLPKEGQPGLLDEADGGVLFLDEVATLPPQAQALLLLPLEGRPFRPAVGTGAERRVDVKFVLATNRDLAEEADLGRFPRDLYERIAGEVIRLPSLRERKDDIPLLTDRFLDQLLDEEGTRRELSPACARVLSEYDWPGNVRELQRSIRHAFRRADLEGRDTIEPADLPEALHSRGPVAAATGGLDEFSERERAEIEALRATRFRVGAAEARLGYSSKSRTLSHRLRGICLKALSLADWDVDNAARTLAGDDNELAGLVQRRLRTQLDGMAARLDEPDERTLSHLLAEHRMYAIEALARLRSR